MRPVVKFFLKRELQRAKEAGDVERVGLINHVFEDDNLFDLVTSAAEEDYNYNARLTQAAGGPVHVVGAPADAFQGFLKFLLENREQIFKTILSFIQILAIV